MKLRKLLPVLASLLIACAVLTPSKNRVEKVQADETNVYDFKALFKSSLGSKTNTVGFMKPFGIEAVNLYEFMCQPGEGVTVADDKGKLPSWDKGDHWTLINKSLYTWAMWYSSGADLKFSQHPEGWRMTKDPNYKTITTYPPQDGKCTAGAQYLNFSAANGELHPGADCGIVVYFTAPKAGKLYIQDSITTSASSPDGTNFCIYKIPASEFIVSETWNNQPIHGLFGGSPIYPTPGVSPSSDWQEGWKHIQPGVTLKYATPNIDVETGDVLALIFGAGFDNTYDLTTTNLKVVYGDVPDTLRFNEREISAVVGDNVNLGYTIEPAASATKTVSWSSSDPTVATVSNGVITALKSGYTEIKATLEDGVPLSGETEVSDICKVTIVDQPTITITNTAAELNVEQAYETQLKYAIQPSSSASATVEWSIVSGDDKISLSNSGLVKGLQVGSAQVKATIAGTTISDTAIVTVKKAANPIVSLSVSTVSIEEDQSEEVTTSVSSLFYKDSAITLDGYDTEIVSASWKDSVIKVTGLKEGTTSISCYVLPEYKTTLKVTVIKKPLKVKQWSKEFSPIPSKTWKYFALHDGIYDDDLVINSNCWGKAIEGGDQQGPAFMLRNAEAGTTQYFAIFNGQCVHPVTTHAAVVRFIAPNDGVLDFSTIFRSENGGSTQRVKVLKNTERIYPTAQEWKVVSKAYPVDLLMKDITVSKGDTFDIIVDSNGDHSSDYCFITPTFKYSSLVPVPDVITLDKTEITMKAGEYAMISAEIEPEESKYSKITWTSSNNEVASVNKYGEVSALKDGQVTITASLESGATATCSVTVLKGDTPTPTPSSSKLSTGAIVGIIVASVLVVGGGVTVTVILIKKKRAKIK